MNRSMADTDESTLIRPLVAPIGIFTAHVHNLRGECL